MCWDNFRAISPPPHTHTHTWGVTPTSPFWCSNHTSLPHNFITTGSSLHTCSQNKSGLLSLQAFAPVVGIAGTSPLICLIDHQLQVHIPTSLLSTCARSSLGTVGSTHAGNLKCKTAANQLNQLSHLSAGRILQRERNPPCPTLYPKTQPSCGPAQTNTPTNPELHDTHPSTPGHTQTTVQMHQTVWCMARGVRCMLSSA